MKLGIRAKLFLVSFGLIVVCVVIGYAYMRAQLEHLLVDAIRADLTVRARLIAMQAAAKTEPSTDIRAWDGFADELGSRGDARVTLIAVDGTVLGDSQVALGQLPSVENHGRRVEIVDAITNGFGSARRHSTTVDRTMLYVAVPFARGGTVAGVARVAMSLNSVEAGLSRLRRSITIATILALAVALVVSSVAAQLASRTARALTRAAQNMAKGDLSARTRFAGDDEFGELGRALDKVARDLSNTVLELRSERDRLSGILAGMQEGVLMLDEHGRVAVVNPALREMLLLGTEAVGKSPIEVIRHAELKELLDHARMHPGETVTGEIELGGLKPRRFLVRAAPLSGAQGIFAVFVDVTEVRRLESMRRDFVANVSHELRTPVTAIRSAAETLKNVATDDPKAATMFVDIIDRNAERLHGLVEDLLDLSRIESRAFKLKLEPVQMRAVFTHVFSLFSDRAQKKSITFAMDAASDLPRVRADRRALEHVLTNLIDNAVKYCGAGCEVKLCARLHGDNVVVSIVDNGPGIAAKHLPRLFERFYRVDAGRSRELGGTGLGLSIVKHLVEAMGSSVVVDSVPGKSTSFSFTLPRANADVEPHEIATLH